MKKVRAVLVVGLASAAGGCLPATDVPPLEIAWEPMEELNAELPSAIRVHRGIDRDAPLEAWYVRVAMTPEILVRVDASPDDDGVETASQIAARTGARVVVNGGYFRLGEQPMRHVGLLLAGGEMVEPAIDSVLRDGVRYYLARGALGFLADGRPDVAWVSSRDGVLYEWPAPPPNAADEPVTELSFEGLAEWPAYHAVAGGPVLVSGGEVLVTTDAEVFFDTGIPGLNPRTAAGVAADGALILLVVDGRHRASRGANLQELAEIMVDLGSHEALNLDGGGSSTLVVDGELVNRPLGAEIEREVMSSLIVLEQ